ncbi:MAG: 23S rRNA (uracil(1939)-C(5))-methyltransferase RlmD [Elusimicrobiota bacterium]
MTSLAAPAAVRCLHFGTCGGCALQNISYEEQLTCKEERVNSALRMAGGRVEKIHASPKIWFYRNKMEFSFGDVYPPQSSGPSLYLGLKPKGRWSQILDLRECHLLSPETPALLETVRCWARNEGLSPYNSRRHSGFLRHLVLREAKNNAERMINIVTAEGCFPAESFLKAAASVYPATTVLHGINNKISDTATAESLEVLHGDGHITEILRLGARELRFRVSPTSFFQTNTAGAEVLYGLARRWIGEIKPENILDIYCGGGGFALSCADLCQRISGVEQNAASIDDARANAALNGIENACFYAGPVETLLPSLLDMKPAVVIADPPRSGLGAKAAAALFKWGPPLLIYVSCNPESLGRDLAAFSNRYRLVKAEMIDLFPHTEHVETAVMLERVG